MDVYTPTETSTVTMFPMDARPLSNGAVAVLDAAGAVLEIVRGEAAETALEAASMAERACWVCDGLGHAYPIGRETFTNGTSRMVIGGGACPLDG